MRKGAKVPNYKNKTLMGVFVKGSEIELPGIKATWKIIDVFWTSHVQYKSGQVISKTHVKLKKQIL